MGTRLQPKMGRYYSGTISGKWGVGLQSSSTPSEFHPAGTWSPSYRCPFGNSEEDDDICEDEVPSDIDDPSSWNEDETHFMETHAECFRTKEMSCFQEREDYIVYRFDSDHYEHVVQKQKEYEGMLVGRSLIWAKWDFNELVKQNAGDDRFCDGSTYDPIVIEDNCPADCTYEERLKFYQFDFCLEKYMEHSESERLQFYRTRPVMDEELFGTPKQPVCCVCKQIAKKDFSNKSAVFNPFSFKKQVWQEGDRFTCLNPFICSLCDSDWFWDPMLNGEERVYYYMPYATHSFHETALTWSFGEQLRQALNKNGSVFISSEC
jgi:hypothetical protein